MYVCIYVCVYIHIYIYIYINTRTGASAVQIDQDRVRALRACADLAIYYSDCYY